MSKVTEELDFMWEKRVSDYYNGFKDLLGSETKGWTPISDKMDIIATVLRLQGLHVKGIDQ